MVRASIAPVSIDLQTQKNFSAIREAVNGGLDFNNLRIQVVEGITGDVPDSEVIVPHSMTPRPHGWLPLIGDVYVQEISEKKIDVRSTKRNVAFKLLLVGGQSIVTENVNNPDSYVDTLGVISDNAGGSAGAFIDGQYHFSGWVGSSFSHIKVIGNYIYFTFNDATLNLSIGRIDTTDNSYTTLTPGATALAGMYYDNTDLWVSELTPVASVVKVYKIDLGTFTVSSTISCAVTAVAAVNMNEVTSIAVDSTYIYLAGRRTNLGNYSHLSKCNKTTGANIASLAPTSAAVGVTAADSGAKEMIFVGNYIYVTNTNNSVSTALHIHKINNTGATFTFDSNITVTGTNGLGPQAAALLDGKIYAPIFPISTGITTGAGTTYGQAILVIDTTNDTYRILPYASFSSNIGVARSTSAVFNKSILEYNGLLYWAHPQNFYTEIYQLDPLSETINSSVILVGSAIASTNSSLQNFMIADTDGAPLLIKQGNSAGTVPFNFTWVRPNI